MDQEARCRPRYDHVKFGRSKSKDKQKALLGVGSAIVDMAIEDACSSTEAFGVIPNSQGTDELFVFRCFDKITGNLAQPKSIICGVLKLGDKLRVLRDQDVFSLLDSIAMNVKPQSDSSRLPTLDNTERTNVNAIFAEVIAGLPTLKVPFKAPDIELLGVIRGEINLERIANMTPDM